MEISPGQIILLNGASSSGKTSIAQALLPLLDQAYYYLPRDAFNSMRHQRPMSPSMLEEALMRLASGFHQSVAGMAAAGNDVLADHVVREESWFLECLRLFPGDVVLVGVHCPLHELERREQSRGDRAVGIAAKQFLRVHRFFSYDVEVDTSVMSAAECAERIKAAVSSAVGERAIVGLRRRYLGFT